MTRYRAPAAERVAAAQFIQAKVTGVNQIQERHALPSSDEFIAKHPDKYERMKGPGVKEAGRKAGAWGGPKDANPYARSPSMHAEAAAWLAGHAIGAAERKRKP